MNRRIMFPIALMATLLVPPLRADDDVAAKIKAINEEYNEAFQEVVADYRAEKDPQKKQEIVSKRLPELSKTFAEKFQDLAKAHAGTPAAIEPLVMACSLAGRTPAGKELADQAKQTLLADYRDQDAFAQAVSMWANDEATLAKLVDESESRSVQGVALYFQMSKAKGRQLTEANVAKVKPLMERITRDYGDVKLVYPGGQERGTLADLVDNELFAFEHLRIGKLAPEIVGEDVDGVEFKLSDYRGKVVVIDFWGDW